MLRRISLFFALSSALLPAQTTAPERTVLDNRILSARDPQVQIQLPKPLQYVGSDRWTLYNVADCEIHVFVLAGSDHKVQQLYWIQFEGYIPSVPTARYGYDIRRHTQLGNLTFYIDSWVRAADEPTRSGSDREHVETLRRAHGFSMPAGMMYVRLVHLLDDQKRRELMIIYGEDLAPTNLTVADLREGGKAHDRWPSIDQGLIDRAQKQIHLQQP